MLPIEGVVWCPIRGAYDDFEVCGRLGIFYDFLVGLNLLDFVVNVVKVLPRLAEGSCIVAFICSETLLSKIEPPLASCDISTLLTTLCLFTFGFLVGDTALVLYGDLYRFFT